MKLVSQLAGAAEEAAAKTMVGAPETLWAVEVLAPGWSRPIHTRKARAQDGVATEPQWQPFLWTARTLVKGGCFVLLVLDKPYVLRPDFVEIVSSRGADTLLFLTFLGHAFHTARMP